MLYMFSNATSKLISIITLTVVFQTSFAYILDLRVPTDTKYAYVAPKNSYLSIEPIENNDLSTVPNKLVTLGNYAATVHTTDNTNMSMGLNSLDLGYTF